MASEHTWRSIINHLFYGRSHVIIMVIVICLNFEHPTVLSAQLCQQITMIMIITSDLP